MAPAPGAAPCSAVRAAHWACCPLPPVPPGKAHAGCGRDPGERRQGLTWHRSPLEVCRGCPAAPLAVPPASGRLPQLEALPDVGQQSVDDTHLLLPPGPLPDCGATDRGATLSPGGQRSRCRDPPAPPHLGPGLTLPTTQASPGFPSSPRGLRASSSASCCFLLSAFATCSFLSLFSCSGSPEPRHPSSPAPSHPVSLGWACPPPRTAGGQGTGQAGSHGRAHPHPRTEGQLCPGPFLPTFRARVKRSRKAFMVLKVSSRESCWGSSHR